MSVDIYILDLLALGLLLLVVTLASGWIVRLPLSYALVYLVVGIFLSPYGINLIQLTPETEFMERLSEFVVIVSLYNCGLKMNRNLRIRSWNSTIRLIALLLPFSIFAVALVGHGWLGLNWGAAILLGAILAPTDPVLASEVQMAHCDDRDELRFGLTSEGGLNDALAFPFVYFGLYYLKDPQWQNWIKDWFVVDVLWAIAAGIGAGYVIAKSILWTIRQLQHRNPAIDETMEDFLAIAIILVTYSLTEVINGYGFIAVFVAGLTIRKKTRDTEEQILQLHFTERIEKLLEVATILLIGSMLRIEPILNYAGPILIISSTLIFLIRPLGTWLSTIAFHRRQRYKPATRLLLGWFGIRGVGSIYYLSYAFGHDLPKSLAAQLGWIVYLTVVISVILHGFTATPLMNWYEKNINEKPFEAAPQPEVNPSPERRT